MVPVLIDSSAWILYFNNTDSPIVAKIDDLIDQERDIVICGPILMEMIQGCRTESEVVKIQDHFDVLIYIPTTEDLYTKAALLYRNLRTSGITVRKSIDCLIAAIAIKNRFELVADDRDFNNIAKFTDLKLCK